MASATTMTTKDARLAGREGRTAQASDGAKIASRTNRRLADEWQYSDEACPDVFMRKLSDEFDRPRRMEAAARDEQEPGRLDMALIVQLP